ncbi:unnamed protein product [Didymodactylos carnosus]|uniref:Uncharacterized protein n=1 Tax=Didymodactylos carnosus TaxID=1234261 RepID=A0A8S2GJN3_9BILA|nr:unnamed protein product [Didymodactylos carnosus]CAF3517525.1 unnamed protein product [Didymodactylos carnosus]
MQASSHIHLPFNVNIIDITVTANVLYGITSAVLNQIGDFQSDFDQDMQVLTQVYYPSHYNFLWYVSRTLFLLEQARQNKQLQPVAFDLVYNKLSNTFRSYVYLYIQNHINKDSDSRYYFEEFLGTNDTDTFGKRTPTGEDRIFSTALVVNCLIASFTYFNATTNQLHWVLASSLTDVKLLIDKSVQWLIKNINQYEPQNCFFGASFENYKQFPYWYPANIYQFLNGTNFNPKDYHLQLDDIASTIDNVICGVQSLIDEQEYTQMLKQLHFNVSTPTTFNGYNQPDAVFPFWLSQPYTYSTTLLALSQYNNLISTNIDLEQLV